MLITQSMTVKGLEQAMATNAKQAVFALAVTLNKTAESRQRRLQDHVASTLTIRQAGTRTQFRRAIRFARDDRADSRRQPLAATVRVIGGDTTATTDLFKRLGAMIIRQDQAGTQTSSALYRTQNRQFTAGGFVIPAPGLRTNARGVPRSLYPFALGLSARSIRYEETDDPVRQYKGGRKKRGQGFRKNTRYYFVKENVGIFVREQLGKKSEYDAVWFFRRQITLPKRVDLAGTFQRGIEQELGNRFVKEFDAALRTAR